MLTALGSQEPATTTTSSAVASPATTEPKDRSKMNIDAS